MSHEIRIRRITADDWDGVDALEHRAYDPLGLSEGRAALESKALASPDTCFALDVDGSLAGYLLALPYPESAYPRLRGTDETPALTSRNLHLHDIVVAEELRHRGLARLLLNHLTMTARAHGYEQISLVAVGGSETFWSARGFTAGQGAPPPAGYGPTAVYMSRAVPAGPVPRRESEKWADAGVPRT
ncbi:GNAT family N-acetyltransferase [Streptomyces sp. BG9H]|uniref:GNAT family N-acetyltransferase n=1 Tax=Streptomyces anatolicus TaxID=2675858 RepID=A0ABS6YPW6_9ACTN|nr:GNAT family N-acetyltransferase [Streptomyces anatolicus]MBW5423069.1 GNAT family N-acetyltransferase [Streptomyces anatolicus]